MKIIHAADLHLGSKIEAKLKDISEERKAEVRNSFLRLAKYAHENDIHVILLSGDVFDSDRPFKKDKDTFYSVIKQYPDIDFSLEGVGIMEWWIGLFKGTSYQITHSIPPLHDWK